MTSKIKQNCCLKHNSLIKNKSAIVDLPMRLVIAIVIGTISLSTILSFISQPCLLPSNMKVTVEPLVISMNNSNTNISFDFIVTDINNKPINNAIITIKGLGTVTANKTNNFGNSEINVELTMPDSIKEGYLDVLVKANCYENIKNEKMIKIINVKI